MRFVEGRVVVAAVAGGATACAAILGIEEPSIRPTALDATNGDGPGLADADAGTTDGPEPIACDPTKSFGPPEVVRELTTAGPDILTDVSPDQLVAYVATSSDAGPTRVHLFYATRMNRSSPFGELAPLLPAGPYNDFSATVTANGLTAVVSSDRNGQSDLFVFTRSSTFATFVGAGTASGVDSPAEEASPRWTADARTIYFDSSRSGSRDIYRASTQGATFGAPEAVTELNTAALEAAPVLSPDERTIYFLSTRPPTTDGDIYVATRGSKSEKFGAITRVEVLSSAGVDVPSWLSPDGCTIYLSSTRNNGDYDVFVARRPR